MFTLVSSAMGAGCLSLPYMLRSSGQLFRNEKSSPKIANQPTPGRGLWGLCYDIAQYDQAGRPGCRAFEINGGSSASYLACAPCIPLFCTLVNSVVNRRPFGLPGRAGVISIARWNLRPVIFAVDCGPALPRIPEKSLNLKNLLNSPKHSANTFWRTLWRLPKAFWSGSRGGWRQKRAGSQPKE